MVSGRPVLVNKSIAAQTSIFKSTVQGSNQTISGATPYSWPAWTGNPSCRIDFTLSSVNGSWPSEIDLTVRSGDGDLTMLVFQPSQSIVALNRSQCGKTPISDTAWNTVRLAVCDFNAPVSVSVFVDLGSVEVFLNGGEQAISALITTPSDATGVALAASGGSAAISNLQIASLS
jgi:levanbiose-producing levanase